MKKEFIGYYNPTENEINEAWTKGAFAFDTNTLLNLYRYTDLTRKDFLSALKTIKDKLFLPHQAALEFHSNRVGVIEGIGNSYTDLYNIFENNFGKNIESQLNQFKKHPSIVIENITKLHNDFLKKISAELEKQKKDHPDFKTKDEVLNQLTELFENVTGKEFSKEEIKKIFAEGKDRYAESIPPGFKDLDNKRKKGDRHIYGDLIIWKELINYSKKEKKPLIFVTDDRKEDWWTIENGKTIRPREELIKEFFDITGIRILIYSADNFLQFAKEKKLVPQLKDNTIKEVKEIRVSDEKSNTTLDDLIKSRELYMKSNGGLAEMLREKYTLKDRETFAELLKKREINTVGQTLSDLVREKELIMKKGTLQALIEEQEKYNLQARSLINILNSGTTVNKNSDFTDNVD